MSAEIRDALRKAVEQGFVRVKGSPEFGDTSLVAAIEQSVLESPDLVLGFLADGELSRVLADVANERARQDEMHGGPEHDDTLSSDDWLELLDSYVARAGVARTAIAGDSYRTALVKVAAIAVAAIQAADRWEPF